jgi:glycosyltransferase involved in cell wall biosynthesis
MLTKAHSGIQVSVIIPVRDDSSGLQRCLAALDGSDVGEEEAEILVIDDGSVCDIRTVVDSVPRHLPMRVIRQDAGGPYAARNVGIDHAGGGVLAFTDSDCIPHEEWLSQGVSTLLQLGTMYFVGGKVELCARERTPAALYDLTFGFPQQQYMLELGFSVTANLFAYRDAFSSVGPFDETLHSGGDREWCIRACQLGYRAHYAPLAVVMHPARSSISQLTRKAFRVMKGTRALGLHNSPANGQSSKIWNMADRIGSEIGRFRKVVVAKELRGFGERMLVALILVYMRLVVLAGRLWLGLGEMVSTILKRQS